MKKLFFIAAIAGVALVSCTKNELAPSATEQDEITFSTPVVAPSTKALIEDAIYPDDETFGVFAWHSSTSDAYMNNEEVSHTAGLADDQTGETASELGGWKPATAYYWPKDGTLDFDAYSPYGVANVSATKANGITITDYTVDASADEDLMYATRAEDKTTSSDGANAGIPYDGVDIAFNHALAAVQIKAKTASEYTGTTIAITSIKIVEANNLGTFNQNEGIADPAGWTTSGAAEYAYANNTVTSAGVDCGTKLLLPQTFTNDLAINITYTINGIVNNGTFLFKDHTSGTCDGAAVTVGSWEMGNRYIYTLVFTLDEIFFEPIVTDWKDIVVS